MPERMRFTWSMGLASRWRAGPGPACADGSVFAARSVLGARLAVTVTVVPAVAVAFAVAVASVLALGAGCDRGATALRAVGSEPAPPGPGAGAAADPAQLRHDGSRVFVPEASPVRSRVLVSPAESKSMQTRLVVPASVESDPARTAKITPPLAGRVVRLFVRFGDTVARDQPLLTMDAPDLVSAQTDYLRAKSAQAQSERTLARQKDLQQHGIGAQKELEQAETEASVAESELERSAVRLRLLGSDPGQLGKQLVVRSPIAGRIVESAVAPGEFHNDQNAVLMTIADLSSVWVTAHVQEKDIRRVRQGQEAVALFVAYPGEKLVGHVLFVGDLLDPDTRTIKVRVAFDNPDTRLKPGMFATMTFTSAPLPEVVVKTTALVLQGDHSYVFVEVAPWTFERRPVEVGETQGDLAVITKGLEAQERVVMRDAVLLQ
jgi:cobalt-zinc-cadmium efflux system membrane fusion protein